MSVLKSKSDSMLYQLVNYSALPNSDRTLERMRAKGSFTPKHVWRSQPHKVGVEVEVERVLNNNPVGNDFIYDDAGNRLAHFNLWDNKEDGSLRNNGREFVSAPLGGVDIEYALDALYNTLHKAASCKGHEFSDRTSVHVHLNVRDLTPEQLSNLVLTYIVVEPVLYNFAGGDRHRNIFCVPLNQTEANRNLFSLFRDPSNFSTQRSFFQSWRKYMGLNLAPVFGNSGQHVRALGTVEFRHMPGNIDVPRLLDWIDLIGCLKDFAIRTDFEKNKERFLALNTTSEYLLLLQDIFGTEYAQQLTFPNLQKRMEESVLFLKECFAIGMNRFEEFFNLEYVQQLVKANVTQLVDGAAKSGMIERVSKSDKVQAVRGKKVPQAPEPADLLDPDDRERLRRLHERVRRDQFIAQAELQARANALRARLDENNPGDRRQPEPINGVFGFDQAAGQRRAQAGLNNVVPAPDQPRPLARREDASIAGVRPVPGSISTEVYDEILRKGDEVWADANLEINLADNLRGMLYRTALREKYLQGTENWTLLERRYWKRVINGLRAQFNLRSLFNV